MLKRPESYSNRSLTSAQIFYNGLKNSFLDERENQCLVKEIWHIENKYTPLGVSR